MRLEPILTPAGNIRMVPMDHGVSDGVVAGLEDPVAAARQAARFATCITAHKGFLRHINPPPLPTLLHVSAGTKWASDPHEKRIVATVEDAMRLGAVGITTHINLGSRTEAQQLQDLGRITSAADEYGVPVITMAYPRGDQMADPPLAEQVAHAARLAWELGSDAVKVPYCPEFGIVTDAIPAPILVAGGPKKSSEDFAKMLGAAAANGAKGVSIGRNVFADQTHVALIRELWP